MSKQSLQKKLTKHGWHTEDERTWKHPTRPDEKILLNPTDWVHLKLDINAPQDHKVIAAGRNEAELDKHLSEISG